MYCTKWLKFYARQPALSRISLTAFDTYIEERPGPVEAARAKPEAPKFIVLSSVYILKLNPDWYKKPDNIYALARRTLGPRTTGLEKETLRFP
jgi:hypothetical protein